MGDFFRNQTMQVICGEVLTGAILAEFTGNTQITLILGLHNASQL